MTMKVQDLPKAKVLAALKPVVREILDARKI
jgi:hypothetical protein